MPDIVLTAKRGTAYEAKQTRETKIDISALEEDQQRAMFKEAERLQVRTQERLELFMAALIVVPEAEEKDELDDE